MTSFVAGFIFGYLLYHVLMNRTVMMNDCCLKHFNSKEHKKEVWK